MVRRLLSKSLSVAHDIVSNIKDAIDSLNETRIKKMVSVLHEVKNKNRKVFVVGEGPSGLVAKALAMRLAELSYDVFVIGETITSAVEKGDVFIVISESGRTPLVLEAAKIAKEKVGAKIISVTASDGSPISKLADLLLIVKTKSIEADDEEMYLSTQLTGSYVSSRRAIFQLAAGCILEAIVSELASIDAK
jgi:6-phospho-3-hexuloisomerase